MEGIGNVEFLTNIPPHAFATMLQACAPTYIRNIDESSVSLVGTSVGNHLCP